MLTYPNRKESYTVIATITDETFMIKGELHYVWPHVFVNRNTVRCDQCRYWVQDVKNKSLHIGVWSGECHSKAHQTERGGVHNSKGWDRMNDIDSCRWWFPKSEEPEMKQLELL